MYHCVYYKCIVKKNSSLIVMCMHTIDLMLIHKPYINTWYTDRTSYTHIRKSYRYKAKYTNEKITQIVKTGHVHVCDLFMQFSISLIVILYTLFIDKIIRDGYLTRTICINR